MELHLMDIHDSKPHSYCMWCECDPSIEIMDEGDLLINHNSFAKKEIIERLEQILKKKKQ